MVVATFDFPPPCLKFIPPTLWLRCFLPKARSHLEPRVNPEDDQNEGEQQKNFSTVIDNLDGIIILDPAPYRI